MQVHSSFSSKRSQLAKILLLQTSKPCLQLVVLATSRNWQKLGIYNISPQTEQPRKLRLVILQEHSWQNQITGQNSHSAPFSQPKPGNDTPTFDQLSPTKVGLPTTKLTVLALPWSPLNYSALLILRLSALPKSFWRALTHISKLRTWAEPNGQSDCFLVKQTGSGIYRSTS